MGGKGQRRREKNYRTAHGGHIGLPPPPDRSSLDAVPSKLRKIMSFSGRKASVNGKEKNGVDRSRVTGKRLHLEDKVVSRNTGIRKEGEDGNPMAKFPLLVGEDVQSSTHGKQKKKRKRKQVKDLRFEASDELGGIGSKRKERKKQRLEERKRKRKSIREGESVDFKVRDQVKFGEVVEAPPKLVAVPKAFKTILGASQERLRIQAIEAYRKRKAWTSRPGVQLPSTETVSQIS